jgi:hypothetical protein
VSNSSRSGRRLAWAAAAAGALLVATGCERCEEDVDGDGYVECTNIIDPEPTTGSHVRIWSGDDQTAPAGATLPDPIEVAVLKNAGGGVQNVVATFEITSGGGELIGATTTGQKVNSGTGFDGVTSVRWQLGSSLGEQTVRVTFANRSNTLTFKAVAHGPAAQLLAIRGNGQTAPPGSAVPVRPVVRLTDIDGRPIANARIAFANTDVAGTNRQGEAVMPVPWVLGTVAGTYQLVATYFDPSPTPVLGNPATFTAIAMATTPVSMVKADGDNQRAVRGTAVQFPPAVRLTDQYGNGVPGIVVTFSREASTSQVVDSVQTTDANGRATVGGWALGLEGTYRLIATAAGSGITGNPATFVATAIPPAGLAAQVLIVSGDQQIGEVDAELANRLVVQVLDDQGQAVAGQLVQFQPSAGSGSIVPQSGIPVDPSITDVNGIAQSGEWRLGTGAGVQYVLLNLPLAPPGLQTPSFLATATPGWNQRMIKAAGDNLTAPVGTKIPIQSLPIVRIVDQFGNPIQGVSVTFAIGSGGGQLGPPASVLTDAGGSARAGGWQLGATTGANTLVATATPALGSVITPQSVTFTATATPPAPVAP